MSDTPIDDTQFSDDEVEEILRRAVDTGSSAPPTPGGRVSLGDLKTIGEEVGISRHEMEAAAVTVLRERHSSSGLLLGAPRVMGIDRTVDGKLSPTAFPDLLATLRRSLGLKGDASEIHGSLEWGTTSELAERYVTLSPAGERTTIRASANLSGLATITFVPPGLLGLIATVIGFTQAAESSSELGIVICLVAMPLLYLVLRTVYGRLAAAEARRLERLVDELAGLLGDPDG